MKPTPHDVAWAVLAQMTTHHWQALTPAQQLKLKKQWYKKHPQRSSK